MGVRDLLGKHPNAQVHALVTLLILPLSVYLKLSHYDWALLILSIVLVLLMEALNSAIEYLADKVSLEQDKIF